MIFVRGVSAEILSNRLLTDYNKLSEITAFNNATADEQAKLIQLLTNFNSLELGLTLLNI